MSYWGIMPATHVIWFALFALFDGMRQASNPSTLFKGYFRLKNASLPYYGPLVELEHVLELIYGDTSIP